jgi:hypothetical protein
MDTGSFPGVKRPGRGVDHPPPSSAEVKERVELYLYSPSWPVLGRTLPLPFTTFYHTFCANNTRSSANIYFKLGCNLKLGKAQPFVWVSWEFGIVIKRRTHLRVQENRTVGDKDISRMLLIFLSAKGLNLQIVELFTHLQKDCGRKASNTF